mgnify:CR=1 FL=1
MNQENIDWFFKNGKNSDAIFEIFQKSFDPIKKINRDEDLDYQNKILEPIERKDVFGEVIDFPGLVDVADDTIGFFVCKMMTWDLKLAERIIHDNYFELLKCEKL